MRSKGTKKNGSKKPKRAYIPIAQLPPKKRAAERARLRKVHAAQKLVRQALKDAQAAFQVLPLVGRSGESEVKKLIAVADGGLALYQSSPTPRRGVQFATGFITVLGQRLGAPPDMPIGSILTHVPTDWALVEPDARRAAVDVVLRGDADERAATFAQFRPKRTPLAVRLAKVRS